MKTKRRRQAELLLGLGAFYIVLWLLWATPVVYPLRIFVVLLHELSHAIAGVATGGTIDRIVLHADEGGATYVRGGNAFVILSAGYLGSLLWGLALIELGRAKARTARRTMYVLAITVLLAAVLFIRNIFGFVFSALFGAALFVGAQRLSPRGHAYVLLGVGLTSALYALLDIRSDILQRPHLPSDANMLEALTGVPTLVWGGLWGAIGLIACWFALRRWVTRT
jgi:hypothetical protein